jgi:hypothetical protein
VSSCFTRLSATVCELLSGLWFPDFDWKWFRALGDVASRKERHRSIPRPHFCIGGLLTFLSISSCSEVIQHFHFGLKFPQGLKFCFFLGILDPAVHIKRPRKGTSLSQPRSLSHHACLFDARFDRYAIARKRYKNKNKLSK